jgi:predicted kinase
MLSLDRPTVLILVGPPGCGKSTLIKELKFAYDDDEPVTVASTDDILEREAAKLGISYNEAFELLDFKVIDRECRETFAKGVNLHHVLVISDQTNMGVKSRAKKLELVRQSKNKYQKIALVFDLPDDVILKRLIEREKTGKAISPGVFFSMKKNFVMPTLAEGFDQVQVLTVSDI